MKQGKDETEQPGKDVAQKFEDLTDNEKIDIVARRILERHRDAFVALAKEEPHETEET